MVLVKLFMVFIIGSLPIALGMSIIYGAIQQSIENRKAKKKEWRNRLEIINL